MDRAAASPLTAADIATALAPLAGRRRLLLAVSGGPDSACLLHMLARWRRDHPGVALEAATVDHGLRQASADEAAAVAAWCGRLGLPHATLRWTGLKPRSGLQAAAREARYALLAAHARAAGADVLLTAHHADDQAETVLMRLAHGSGLRGLAGMAPLARRPGGLLHARPLLHLPKARLVATLAAWGEPSFEDPSNADPRHGRSRARALAPLLAREGLSPGRLLRLAERARRAEEALDALAREAFARHACRDGAGTSLAPGLFDEAPEIVIRVLLEALGGRADQEIPALRLARVEALAVALAEARAEGRALRRTIAGQVMSLDRHARVTIRAEKSRRRGRGAAGAGAAFIARQGASC
ncbi:MAG: tRNA lysidine(34) synthetase TilS [Alsobacter sp.]